MKTGWVKIVGIAAIVVFLCAGVSLAGGRDYDNGRHNSQGDGHYRGGDHHPYGHHYGHGYYRPYYGPSYHHYYRPHCPAPRVIYPTPGYYFGMSAVQPGVSFGFGVQGY